MNQLRSRRAFFGLALIVLVGACDSSQAPGSTSSTNLLPPVTDPAFPDAKGTASHHTAGEERELEVEVQNVEPGTELDFFYNTTHFGDATVNSQGRARIQLRTADGASVPFAVLGATISVQSEGIVVVTGRF